MHTIQLRARREAKNTQKSLPQGWDFWYTSLCMKKYILTFLFGALALAPKSALAFEFNPNNIISDYVFTDSRGLTLDGVQQFLSRGFLGTHKTTDFEGNVKSAAEIIYESSLRYGVNPKVLIVLLQKEQSLITSKAPTQKQLDWATGYAVCDSCAMDDPRIARWKGFGKQVNSAAAQFTQGYFADIEEKGSVNGKFGPGIPVEVTGQIIVPQNAATAALYAYTPHIAGNRLFASLWEQWFSVHHPEGALVKSVDKPEIYVIKGGMRRHIASYSVLTTRFDENLVTTIDEESLQSIPEGAPIKYPNYTLLSVDGGRFLIVDDTVRPFDSVEAFRKFGFQDDELVEAEYADLSSYEYGDTITKYTQYPTGRLVQVESGSYFYLEDQYRYFVDPALIKMQFRRYPVFKTQADTLGELRDGGFVKVGDGYLVKTESDSKVYLISEGKKRWISSEDAFKAFGWSPDKVITVSQELLDLHEEGDIIEGV